MQRSSIRAVRTASLRLQNRITPRCAPLCEAAALGSSNLSAIHDTFSGRSQQSINVVVRAYLQRSRVHSLIQAAGLWVLFEVHVQRRYDSQPFTGESALPVAPHHRAIARLL